MRDRALQLRVRPQAAGFFEVTECAGKAPGEAGERDAQVDFGIGIVGFDAQGSFQFDDGAGGIASPQQCDAAAAVSFGPTAGLGLGQIAACFLVGGVQPQRSLELFDGFRQAAGSGQRTAEVGVFILFAAAIRTNASHCAKQFADNVLFLQVIYAG